MKERGILFQGPLVRALLAGTKTQTRRLPKPPMTMTDRGGIAWRGCAYGMRTDGSPYLDELLKRCPYGVPGDRLWVRETWDAPPGSTERAEVAYRADYERDPDGAKWRSSMYMPRWASRITLEVTEVRVQRLQEITEEDARAEGVTTGPQQGQLNGKPATLLPTTHRQAFIWLWDAINGERASWVSNPWVWCVTFKRVETMK